MQDFFIAALIVGVVGVVVAEVFLIYALIRPNQKITTRKCGKYILLFFALAVVSAMVLMGINR